MTSNEPVVCDMSGAPDTIAERLAAYRRLFATVLVGRDREEALVRFRFQRAAEDDVRELAAREQACCAFFEISVRVVGGEVWWETRVGDDPAARAVLAELATLPDGVPDADGVAEGLAPLGLRVN